MPVTPQRAEQEPPVFWGGNTPKGADQSVKTESRVDVSAIQRSANIGASSNLGQRKVSRGADSAPIDDSNASTPAMSSTSKLSSASVSTSSRREGRGRAQTQASSSSASASRLPAPSSYPFRPSNRATSDAASPTIRDHMELQNVDARQHAASSVVDDIPEVLEERERMLVPITSSRRRRNRRATVGAEEPAPFWSVGAWKHTTSELGALLESQLQEMGFSEHRVRFAINSVGLQKPVDHVLKDLTGVGPQMRRSVASASGPPTGSAEKSRGTSDGNRQFLEPQSPQQRKSNELEAATARLLLSVAEALRLSRLTREQETQLCKAFIFGDADLAQELMTKVGCRESSVVEELWCCQICFEDQRTKGWACPEKHRFCEDCLRHHIDAVLFPSCPFVGCTYELGENDFKLLCVSTTRIESFQQAKLGCALDKLAGQGETLVRCLRTECEYAAVVDASEGRVPFECPACAAPAFCSQCRQVPYHYSAECSEVQDLREQWLKWLSGGRDAYHGYARKAERSELDVKQNEALQDAIKRHNELEADELWKARHCRLCPHCSRPVVKIDGCNQMVCGRDYHGGEQQQGCGSSFKWQAADSYVARVERKGLPDMSKEELQVRGSGVFHPFIDCTLCGTEDACAGIAGLRFRCLHCKDFDVCGDCEPRLGSEHNPEHVFEIMFESEFEWNFLPKGTKVRLVRDGDSLPRDLGLTTSMNLQGRPDRSLEGSRGWIIGKRKPPLVGYRVLLDNGCGTVKLRFEHLEPLLKDTEDTFDLLKRTLESEHAEDDLISDEEDFRDDNDSAYYYLEEEEEEEELEETSESETVSVELEPGEVPPRCRPYSDVQHIVPPSP